MKIVQICAIDFTMYKFLSTLNNKILEEGHELTLICSEGPFSPILRQEGFNVINIEIDRKITPRNLKSIKELTKVLKVLKPDIVHVHTPIASVLGRIASKLAKVKICIYTAHGFYFHDNMPWLKYKIYYNIEKFMARYFTDYLFTQSEEDATTAIENKFLDSNYIKAIGNGIDIKNHFNVNNIKQHELDHLRQELSITDDDLIVTYVGRIVEEKGIFDLLDAFDNMPDNIKLVVVGDIVKGSRDVKSKHRLGDYKHNKHIVFTGYRNDIKNILSITDVFCLPSYREGMPRSIIEAMAMQCAVIATNIRGSREEVVDGITGFVVPIKNHSAIKDKVLSLYQNSSLLASMKAEGQKRAKELYDEDNVVDIQMKVYHSLI